MIGQAGRRRKMSNYLVPKNLCLRGGEGDVCRAQVHGEENYFLRALMAGSLSRGGWVSSNALVPVV